MKTLVIPDVHENVARLNAIIASHGPHVNHIVMLGDYFDSWTHSETSARDMCDFLNAAAAQPDRYTLLMGNHDIQYLYPGRRNYLCSGYQRDTAEITKTTLTQQTRDAMRIHAWIGDSILCSHAGLNRYWVKESPEQPLTAWIKEWLAMVEKRFCQERIDQPLVSSVGQCRGGYRGEHGGLLWCDWFDEFQPIPGITQIVGHSTLQYPEQRRGEGDDGGIAWNFDTNLRYVAIVTPEDEDPVQCVDAVPVAL